MSANDSGKSADGDALTLQDKLERYLSSRKTPVTMQMLAARFMVDPKTVRKAMVGITGIVIVIVGQTYWYRRKV